ncbi:MAG: hypothetical protein QM706_17180 [Nitrospira sp.]
MEAVLRHDCASHGHDVSDRGRLQAVRAIVTGMVPSALNEIDQLCETVLPEFDAYGELIAAVDAPVAGLLLRGEGADFTRRVSALMARWEMTEEARRYHLHLADSFEHKRIFLKLEWHAVGQSVERQVAVYYRRRPSVHDALRILTRFTGVSVPVEDVREIGSLLGKDTVHFVAFTARPNQPVWHKFYFSQYVTPATGIHAEARLQRVVQRFVSAGPSVARWAMYHDRLVPRHAADTMFVSLAVTEDGYDGSLKIDYPGVSPVVAAGLLDGLEAENAHTSLHTLCDVAGRPVLSYLGVRMGRGEKLLLKGYADLP